MPRSSVLFLGLLIACAWSASHAQSLEEKFQSLQSKPEALYTFLKAMPKGGELHYHYDGTVYAEKMLQIAQPSPLCIDRTSWISQACRPQDRTISVKNAYRHPNITTKIVHAWSMQDFIPHSESAHDHFFSVFPKVGAIYSQPELKGPLLAAILQKAAEQHELYMEIIAFGLDKDDFYAKLIQNEPSFSRKTEILLANPAFQQSVARIVEQSHHFLPAAHSALHCDKQKQAACDIQVNFQYYIRRVKSLDSVFAQTLAGFVAAQQAPNLVAINLLDIEDNFIAQRDYAQHMRIFDFFHHRYPETHIALHAGELFPKQIAAHTVISPIRDAILIGHAERIGHGLDILEEPNPQNLATLMSKQHIAVEINLTSNRLVFGVKGRQHPFHFYLEQNIPIVLSTDDEGILRTELTQEYVSAVRDHHIDYTTLKYINRNTLTYGFIAGKSIWANPQTAELVPECTVLSSETCRAFIKHSPKARLQWALEKKLAAFETSNLDT